MKKHKHFYKYDLVGPALGGGFQVHMICDCGEQPPEVDECFLGVMYTDEPPYAKIIKRKEALDLRTKRGMKLLRESYQS